MKPVVEKKIERPVPTPYPMLHKTSLLTATHNRPPRTTSLHKIYTPLKPIVPTFLKNKKLDTWKTKRTGSIVEHDFVKSSEYKIVKSPR